jgi:hypothetical protein
VNFSDQARRAAATQGVDDRGLRDAAEAHIRQAHPDLDDRLTESFEFAPEDQADDLLQLIERAGSGDEFLGYIEFLGPDN